MSKISQGKYKLFTTKADAIDKFMQLQGVCREELSNDYLIQFYCSKKGKISITNPPKRDFENESSTSLFAEIIEQDGKTYISYYTAFSKSHNILKKIFIVIYLLMAIFAIAVAIIGKVKTYYLPILIFGVASFSIKLFAGTKEKKNSLKDSETLINELEKRVEAVNRWDK